MLQWGRSGVETKEKMDPQAFDGDECLDGSHLEY
jgi:hypothetical protein